MAYVVALLLLFLGLLQVTVLPAVPVVGVRPDLVLLLALAWTMVRGLEEGAVGAFVGGLVLDILSSFPLGSHSLALLLTVVPIGLLGAPFYRGNLAVPLVGSFLATLLYHLILLLLLRIMGPPVVFGGTFWRMVVPLAVMEATLMPLLYWILDRLDRRWRRRPAVA